jgi:DNA-directed RNA polymerase subunit K/omega
MNTDLKKVKVEPTTVTRNISEFSKTTGNIYEAVAVISKRANQLATQVKEELNGKLSEFASVTDTLEEIFENREQIEIAKHYERLPKSTLVAINEFEQGKVYSRNPSKETMTEEKNI